MNRTRIAAALTLCAILTALPAAADVIYDNGTPDLVDATISDADGYSEVAMDFQLQAGANLLTDVHWWGLYAFTNDEPATDDFTIRIFADVGGTPGQTALHEFNGIDGNRNLVASLGGLDLYEYSADLTPTLLDPATTYWISIINSTPSVNDNWYWADSAQSGNGHIRGADGGAWNTFNYEEAFYLTGTSPVPEPASMTLLGLGLAALAYRRKKH